MNLIWKIYFMLFLAGLFFGFSCNALRATQDKEFILKVQFKGKNSCEKFRKKFLAKGFEAECTEVKYY